MKKRRQGLFFGIKRSKTTLSAEPVGGPSKNRSAAEADATSEPTASESIIPLAHVPEDPLTCQDWPMSDQSLWDLKPQSQEGSPLNSNDPRPPVLSASEFPSFQMIKDDPELPAPHIAPPPPALAKRHLPPGQRHIPRGFLQPHRGKDLDQRLRRARLIGYP